MIEIKRYLTVTVNLENGDSVTLFFDMIVPFNREGIKKQLQEVSNFPIDTPSIETVLNKIQEKIGNGPILFSCTDKDYLRVTEKELIEKYIGKGDYKMQPTEKEEMKRYIQMLVDSLSWIKQNASINRGFETLKLDADKVEIIDNVKLNLWDEGCGSFSAYDTARGNEIDVRLFDSVSEMVDFLYWEEDALKKKFEEKEVEGEGENEEPHFLEKLQWVLKKVYPHTPVTLRFDPDGSSNLVGDDHKFSSFVMEQFKTPEDLIRFVDDEYENIEIRKEKINKLVRIIEDENVSEDEIDHLIDAANGFIYSL